jgi:multidrug efflux pump subunit AcrB
MVVLHDRHHRKAQSHDVAKRLRAKIAPLMIARGARLTVAEVPPGPPVLAPLVAEVYGNDADRAKLSQAVLRTFETTVGVGDVDIYADAPYARRETAVDAEKASLNGITAADVAHVAQTAMAGRTVALARTADEPESVDVRLRMQQAFRDETSGLSKVTMFNRAERAVPIGMISTTQAMTQDGAIYHKNLLPVTYVVGDAIGRLESPPYAVFSMMPKVPAQSVKWDGEWQITLEVFRDLGIAFALVLILIYMLVVGWFKSFTVPFVIMAPIPLTLVGIAPEHWLTGTFFSATSMIGMIAGAGIVVRNSIILVDFIEQRIREGEPLAKAVVEAGAIRFRPMLLTAAAVMLGSSVMLSDPIFKGLAVSLMFGEIASTLLSRNMVPVLYYLLKRERA